MKKFLRLTNSTLSEHKVKNLKELWNKVKSDYRGLEVEVFTSFKKARGEDNRFHAVFSTAKEDRHGDIVVQEWDLKSFQRNPVFLDSHNYDSIEYIIGGVEGINNKSGKLEGDVIYALKNPRGRLAYDLTVEGFINTTSVGFIPKEFDDKGTILKSELLEISAVSVPANPEALIDKLYDGKNNKNKGGDGDIEPRGKGDQGGRGENENDDETEKLKRNDADINKDKIEARRKYWNDNWDEGPELIRLKVRDIGEFEDGSFKREKVRKTMPIINGISGKSRRSGERVLQSLFFPKNDGWSLDDARKWFTLHEYEIMGKTFNDQPKEKKELIKEYLIELGNKHAESRKKGMQKVLLAVLAIKEATGDAKFAELQKKEEVRRLFNKTAKEILKLKKEIYE